jgi:Lar family restriction alleviation protein
MEKEMKPCPFCKGNKLKIDSKAGKKHYNGVGDYKQLYTLSVRCNRCHARGPAVSVEVMRRDFRSAFPDAEAKAIDAWNERLELF